MWEIQFVLRVQWHASMRVGEFVGYRNISDYLVITFDTFRKCQSKFPPDVPDIGPSASNKYWRAGSGQQIGGREADIHVTAAKQT